MTVSSLPPELAFWVLVLFVTWAITSIPAWLLIIFEKRPTLRRIFGALTFALLLAHTTACVRIEQMIPPTTESQPIGDPCDYCPGGWLCCLIGCSCG